MSGSEAQPGDVILPILFVSPDITDDDVAEVSSDAPQRVNDHRN